jgi:hypothetical protein
MQLNQWPLKREDLLVQQLGQQQQMMRMTTRAIMMMPMGIVIPMMVPADNVTGRSIKSESVKNQESQISCWHLTLSGKLFQSVDSMTSFLSDMTMFRLNL